MMSFLTIYSRERGFSLIELLVTLAIMGIAIVPIMMSYVRTWQATIAAKRLTTATMLARKNIEQLESANSFNDIPTGNKTGSFNDAYNEYSWKRSVAKLPGSGNSYNAKQIQIRVTYNSMITGGPRSVSCLSMSSCNSWDYGQVITKQTP